MIRLIAAPPDAVLPGGTIDAQKGYPTADDTPEGLAHLTAHQSLSEVPLTIYRVRRDATWWVIVPDGTTLLTSLPGDIPGLLRRGSPVSPAGEGWTDGYGRPAARHARALVRAAAIEASHNADSVHLSEGWGNTLIVNIALDLTDPTGRWHAAVWAEQAATYADVMEALRHVEHAFYVEAIDAICRAKACRVMTPTQIDTLARLVLRLAGRTA